ncbi:MAG: T9SS type A sorting domain-containing protein [Janthinobacterium lividum]
MQKGTDQTTSAANLVFLTTGSTDNTTALAVDLFLDFTGRTAGTLSFDYAAIANSTGNRGGSLKVYTSIDGTTFTELTAASVNNLTNNVAATGSKSAVALPTSFSGSSTARIRFYYHNGVSTATSPTGSRPKISIDNLAVTSTAATSTSPTLTVTPTSLSVFGARTGAPSAAQSYALKGSNLPADVVVTAPNGYEVSLDNTTFFGNVTAPLSTVQTTNGQTIYVRLTGTTASTYGTSTSPVNVTNTSTNSSTAVVTSANEPVYGSTVTPTLTAAPTSLSGFTYAEGSGPSGIQNYVLTITDAPGFAGSVVATAPTNYEISTSSSFATTNATITFSYTGSQNITAYVRLKSGLLANGSPYTGTITNNHSTLSLTAPVSVSGTVTAGPPTITVSPTTALTFATTTGTPSAEQSYAVSATNLTANLTVTAPAGYEISLASGTYTGTGANTLTLTPSSGTVASTTIYVRLTGAAAGTFGTSGTPVNITHSSTNATTVNKPVSGTVTNPSLATYFPASLTGRATSAPATAKDANISTAADLTRSSTLTTTNVSTSANLFGATNWSLLALADAQANDKYVAFAITPTLGFVANVINVVGNVYRTSNGPATVELLYSFTSDFANPVSLGTQTPTATATGAGVGATITFTPATGTLQGITTPIYFRLYGYGATSAAGILYFTNNTTSGAPGLVVNGNTAASTQPVIATGTVTPTAVCGGTDLTATYTTGGPAATGTYFVQLSDASGSFTSPLNLTTTSSTSSSITATVPATVASGTGYRVRVANTDGTRGSVSAVFTVVSNPTATVTPAAPQALNSNTSGTTLTVTETPAGTSRQWFYATTSGGPYTAISGATGLTYTPTFSAVGTYYVVAQSTFAACGTVISNEVVVTVTTPTLTAAPTALTGFSTTAGSASAAQTYVLTGTGVLAPVTVTAPTGYEVSLDGTNFAASASVPAASANAGQTIYVRLLGSAVGSASGSVTNTVGTVTASVSVSGTVVVPPGMLLVEDDFDYNAGESLTAHGWTGSTSTTTVAGNITANMYPQGAVLSGSTSGVSTRASLTRSNSVTLYRTATVPTDATTFYAAALINVTAVQNVTGDDFFLSFLSGTSTARGVVTIARVSGSVPNTFNFRLRTGSSSASSTIASDPTPVAYSLNVPLVMVFKVENSSATGNLDVYSLYVMSAATAALSQEPTTPLLTVTGGNFFSTISSLSLRQSDANNPVYTLDGLRLATGWGAAVGNVTYSALASSINPGSYYNLTSSNNGLATQAGAVTVENQLALTGGRLALNGQTLTLAGTVTGTGTLTGSTTSNLVVLGTGALGTLNFTPGSQTLNNLTLNRTSTGTATLGSPLTIGGTLALTNGTLATSAAGLPTLGASATFTGGSATSFVSGPLARITTGPAATTFPIGKGTAYRPLTLTATTQTSAATYTAGQVEGNTSRTLDTGNGQGSKPLQRVSKVRYYSVTTSNASSGFAGTITLSYDTDDYVNVPSSSELVVAKRDGGTSGVWTNIDRSSYTGPAGAAGGTSVAGTLTSAPFNSFSDFALASTDNTSLAGGGTDPSANPLPVSLTRFTAARSGSSVALTWTTASEHNSARFEVERSLDGLSFANVATVAAHGTSLVPLNYATLDRNAPTAGLYYRLRLVDADGSSAYSNVVAVAGTGEALTLSPNPAHDQVRLLTETPTAYVLRSALGQVVLQGTTQAGATTVELRGLAAGVYFVELHTSAGRVVRKLVKE